MLVAPDSTTRVAASEAITLKLEADASISTPRPCAPASAGSRVSPSRTTPSSFP